MRREPGFMGLAKQRAKKKPLTKEQMMHRDQVSKMIQADQTQSKGMRDKMMAWKQLQKDKENMIQVPEQYETPQGEMEQLAYVTPEEMQMLKQQGGSGEMTEYGIPSFRANKGDKERKRQKKSSGREVGGDVTGTGFFTARDDDKNRPESQGMWEDAKRSFRDATQTKNPKTGKWEWNRPNTSGGNMGGSGKEMEEINRQAGIGRGPTPMQIAQEERAKAEEKRKQERHEQQQKWGEQRQGYIDEYGGYKGEYKELGKEFGQDKEKLAGYQGKFDTMAGEARAVGDKGATAMEGIGEGYKGITGDAIAAEAKKGQAGFEQGATDVAGVQEQFGKEGFQKDIRGMSEKALSGDLGQAQAEQLRGKMEQQRMASQKGSEEKLRRELAQSGASPSEIASKVAQFQRQSASDQATASRSEALSSQLQGQQMGQSMLGQAAQLKGQEAGMASQQASLGAQQAALRGQAAGMGMQGAQAQQQAQLASLQGQGAAIQSAAGLASQGIAQQAGMYGQGMGAIQAAGAARGQQAGMIGEQAGMTQAQLNDVMAQQTQAYQEEQARLQRQTNAQASSGGGGGGSGGILGGFTKALGISDIRLKDNIQLLEEGKGGDPNIYSFNYKWDKETKWRGVMAQELIGTKHFDAVINTEGFYMVDYAKLGFPMEQI